MAAADDDDFHTSGNLVRGKFNDYQEGGHGSLNRGPAFSQVLARMWGKTDEVQNADAIQAAAMTALTASQYAKRNEQKHASPMGAKKVPNGPGF